MKSHAQARYDAAVAQLRTLTYAQLQRMSMNALLDNKQVVSTAVADEMQRRLNIQLGKTCPCCGSKNVNSNDEYGECADCDNHWYFDDEEIYHD